jgi:hypothetical protein
MKPEVAAELWIMRQALQMTKKIFDNWTVALRACSLEIDALCEAIERLEAEGYGDE